MKTKEVTAILTALNSSNNLGFKYPFGNVELTNKVKQLEANNIIFYSEVFKTWRKVEKPRLSPTQKSQGELAGAYGRHLDKLIRS
jgi:hypothetical protein